MKRRSPVATVLLVIGAMIALGLPTSGFGQIPRRTATPTKPTKPPAESPLPLKVAAGVVQKTVAEYQTKADSLPKLESAELDFKVQTEGVVGGGIGIFAIFTIGVSRTEAHVNDVTFSYSVPKPTPSPGAKPPGPDRSFTITDLGAMDINTLAQADINMFANALAADTTTPKVDVKKFHDELFTAITNAAKSVKDVPSIGDAKFEKFAVTIEYSVKWEGNASGNIPVFSFLTVTPKLGASQNSVHSVKLIFKPLPTSSGPTPTPSP